MDFIKTKIVSVSRPGDGYAYLSFAGDRPIAGAPGQFVMIRGDFGSDPILPRAFSLVASGDTGAVLVRSVGKATRRLTNMQVGDPLFVLGPLGNTFTSPTSDQHPVLVAGGVGVAPLIFLAEKMATSNVRPTFIYGGRTANDLLFESRIKQCADLLLTTEDGSQGEKGMVTGPLSGVLSTHKKVAMYSCGPEPMLKALFKVAKENKATLQVALEQAMACGMGTCKGCAVHGTDGKYKYVCSDGPVFDATEVFGGVS